MPKYPDIEVEIDDGNAFLIIGRVRKAMKKHKLSEKEINKFTDEAEASDYDNLLQTCMEWVELT